MEDRIKYLIGLGMDAVVHDSILYSELIDIYKKIFFKETYCGCQAKYYYFSKMKNEGINMLKNYEEIKNRTHILNWSGLKYNSIVHEHINSETLTDADAIRLLKSGGLKESDFKVLPNDYIQKIEEPVTEITEIIEVPKSFKKKK